MTTTQKLTAAKLQVGDEVEVTEWDGTKYLPPTFKTFTGWVDARHMVFTDGTTETATKNSKWTVRR
jgi:hypothetical protein